MIDAVVAAVVAVLVVMLVDILVVAVVVVPVVSVAVVAVGAVVVEVRVKVGTSSSSMHTIAASTWKNWPVSFLSIQRSGIPAKL